MAASRNALIAVAVVAAGAAGILAGRWISERRIVEVTEAPAAAWKAGDDFPAIALTTEWGDSLSTDALLAHGGVVLFLDLECPPCADMARKWDRAVSDGIVPAEQVVAITSQPGDAISRFRADTGVQIAVYRDPGPSFLLNGWVTSFPVEVIVGADGAVAAVSYDAAAPVDEGALRAALATGEPTGSTAQESGHH